MTDLLAGAIAYLVQSARRGVPIACPCCPRTFKTVSGLTCHLREYHSTTVEAELEKASA